MKKNIKIFSALLALGGLALVIAIYCLFFWMPDSVDVSWLNLVVCILVYCLLGTYTLDIFGSLKRSEDGAAGFGLRWRGLALYTIAAVACVVLAQTGNLRFSLALILQLVILFMFAGYCLMAGMVVSNVQEHAEKETSKKALLKDISFALSMLESECSGSEFNALTSKITMIAEEIRFISPSDSAIASELEAKILTSVRQVSGLLAGHASQESVSQGVDEISRLVVLRKKQY